MFPMVNPPFYFFFSPCLFHHVFCSISPLVSFGMSLHTNVSAVATHRFTAEEGDWGFTRFYDLRTLFNEAWEGKNVPLVQDDEANVTAYVRVVKDPTGVLWHSFQKYFPFVDPSLPDVFR